MRHTYTLIIGCRVEQPHHSNLWVPYSTWLPLQSLNSYLSMPCRRCLALASLPMFPSHATERICTNITTNGTEMTTPNFWRSPEVMIKLWSTNSSVKIRAWRSNVSLKCTEFGNGQTQLYYFSIILRAPLGLHNTVPVAYVDRNTLCF